ncbi:uncharacterized protein LOC122403028 [Colletes gigas]|uniref:uncharacterized protein LOC122403028 n=1 Tax=Colletes gigas TaxID=935657 RepID=UPI001C9A8AAF|nr:uncharacterized protein LOC122403028 [Colletes gigas]
MNALRLTVEKLQEELRVKRYRLAIVQERLVPEFDPSDDESDIKQWVRDVDRIARLAGWCDDDVMCNIERQLRGHARQLFDEEQRRDTTWGTLKSTLVAWFKKPVPFNRLLKEAADYAAMPGQKLGDYCFTKLAKLRALKLEIPDKYMRDAVIGSIGDEAIERTIRANKYATVDELYVAMRQMGSMPTADETLSMKTSQPVACMSTAVPGSSGLQPSKRKSGDGKRPNTRAVCFNCGEEGQISRSCLKYKHACSACMKKGHMKRYCFRVKATTHALQKST